MKLISLADHNKAIADAVPDPFLNSPQPNGIACPRCSKELRDTAPLMILTSHPPRKSVHCPACGFTGTRLA